MKFLPESSSATSNRRPATPLQNKVFEILLSEELSREEIVKRVFPHGDTHQYLEEIHEALKVLILREKVSSRIRWKEGRKYPIGHRVFTAKPSL